MVRFTNSKYLAVRRSENMLDIMIEISQRRLKRVQRFAEFLSRQGLLSWIESAYGGIWLVIRLFEKVSKNGS
ncbi:MAG: hypothetical protein DRJ44_03905 [Thermoprotei archaeon]|nr:MAG: hypothetical protein DRJ44_03905 [Thermoprotei archaeon]